MFLRTASVCLIYRTRYLWQIVLIDSISRSYQPLLSRSQTAVNFRIIRVMIRIILLLRYALTLLINLKLERVLALKRDPLFLDQCCLRLCRNDLLV